MGTNLVLVHSAPEVDEGQVGSRNPVRGRYDMPEITLSAIHHAGKLAATKLTAILQRPDFSEMPVKTQLEVINVALDRAYGSNVQGIKPEKPVEAPKQLTDATAALRQLAGRIVHPEMAKANTADDDA